MCGRAASISASVTPRRRIYGRCVRYVSPIVSEQMVARYPNALSDERYGAWFAGYVSDAYRQTNQDLIERIDVLGASVDEATVQHLCEIFENCCRFDLHFWDMVYTMGQQRAPLCSGEA